MTTKTKKREFTFYYVHLPVLLNSFVVVSLKMRQYGHDPSLTDKKKIIKIKLYRLLGFLSPVFTKFEGFKVN